MKGGTVPGVRLEQVLRAITVMNVPIDDQYPETHEQRRSGQASEAGTDHTSSIRFYSFPPVAGNECVPFHVPLLLGCLGSNGHIVEEAVAHGKISICVMPWRSEGVASDAR